MPMKKSEVQIAGQVSEHALLHRAGAEDKGVVGNGTGGRMQG